MSLLTAWQTVRGTRRVSETLRQNPDAVAGPSEIVGSLQLRHVDAGSCNGCELEITSAFGPTYDAERFGSRLVASPRHADGLIVTGPVTYNMVGPLRKTLEATPRPCIVIALGDCARDCGVFRGGYGVVGAVGEVIDVDVTIPGCPPDPTIIIEALRGLTRR
jgi:Ni,Fe-hydrogenase III small subunit